MNRVVHIPRYVATKIVANETKTVFVLGIDPANGKTSLVIDKEGHTIKNIDFGNNNNGLDHYAAVSNGNNQVFLFKFFSNALVIDHKLFYLPDYNNSPLINVRLYNVFKQYFKMFDMFIENHNSTVTFIITPIRPDMNNGTMYVSNLHQLYNYFTEYPDNPANALQLNHPNYSLSRFLYDTIGRPLEIAGNIAYYPFGKIQEAYRYNVPERTRKALWSKAENVVWTIGLGAGTAIGHTLVMSAWYFISEYETSAPILAKNVLDFTFMATPVVEAIVFLYQHLPASVNFVWDVGNGLYQLYVKVDKSPFRNLGYTFHDYDNKAYDPSEPLIPRIREFPRGMKGFHIIKNTVSRVESKVYQLLCSPTISIAPVVHSYSTVPLQVNASLNLKLRDLILYYNEESVEWYIHDTEDLHDNMHFMVTPEKNGRVLAFKTSVSRSWFSRNKSINTKLLYSWSLGLPVRNETRLSRILYLPNTNKLLIVVVIISQVVAIADEQEVIVITSNNNANVAGDSDNEIDERIGEKRKYKDTNIPQSDRHPSMEITRRSAATINELKSELLALDDINEDEDGSSLTIDTSNPIVAVKRPSSPLESPIIKRINNIQTQTVEALTSTKAPRKPRRQREVIPLIKEEFDYVTKPNTIVIKPEPEVEIITNTPTTTPQPQPVSSPIPTKVTVNSEPEPKPTYKPGPTTDSTVEPILEYEPEQRIRSNLDNIKTKNDVPPEDKNDLKQLDIDQSKSVIIIYEIVDNRHVSTTKKYFSTKKTECELTSPISSRVNGNKDGFSVLLVGKLNQQIVKTKFEYTF